MKREWAVTIACACTLAAGCNKMSASLDPSSAGGYRSSPVSPMADAPTLAASETGSAPAKAVIAEPSARPLPQSGQLTAGVWDDNLNFAFFQNYANRVSQSSKDLGVFAAADQLRAHARAEQRAAHRELDVALVLDTTGSMGDELSYLQSEFDSIVASLRAKFPGLAPRFSLVVYRDHGDDYLTRPIGFTTDPSAFRSSLRAQSAGGGGDFPEAVVEGLRAGLAQDWRSDADVARMIFWVADAPPHGGEGSAFASVVHDALDKDIHLYPVASSGIDDGTEFQMRAAAQLTGGRYLFLTNDSGIGDSHAEPHIPCYSVTRLDHAIVRMIEMELGGGRATPQDSEIVRRVGNPDGEGRCNVGQTMVVAL